MNSPYSCLIILLFCAMSPLPLVAPAAHYILEHGQTISGNQTVVSPAGSFALGFFQLGNAYSFAGSNRYLGIWYKNIPVITPVWVANRQQPIIDPDAFLTVTEDNNIAVVGSNGSCLWSSNVSGITGRTAAKLLESGNLVLRRANGQDVWESFDHPTDTLLPEMKIGYNIKTGLGQGMVAWRDVDDPFPGDFSLNLSSLQIFILGRNQIYWKYCIFIYTLRIVAFMDKFPVMVKASREGDIASIVYSRGGISAPVRFTLESSGKLKMLIWTDAQKNWETLWSAPSQFCDFYGRCGPWGSCNKDGEPPTCDCLIGFVPKNQTEWENKIFSSGCVRRAPLLFSKNDNFYTVVNTELPYGFEMTGITSQGKCRFDCLSSNKCTAYAFSNSSIDTKGYLCLHWLGDLSNIQMPNSGAENLYIRLGATEIHNIKISGKILLPSVLSLGAILALAACLGIVMRLRLRGKRRARRMMMFEHVCFPGADATGEQLSDAPFVDLKTVKCATRDFSDANKLGEGGFSSVYKGNLPSGHEIAVKRLSTGAEQGQVEFANEVRLIAKLQHKNLVRLLGWCTERDEKILIYEYMPSGSLDKHIFAKSAELSWDQRFRIIEGIADGLLYLHYHSRMRVIHRDLKTSNILLDSHMNPKISDFGLAKIIQINQPDGNASMIIGTFGYMSPEYAIDGIFSEKSDVFSFGVILLEVITGKRSTGYYAYKDSLSFLGYAWQLWNEGRIQELLAPGVGGPFPMDKALKFITVGLLCVEEESADRPSMSSVVSMLASESCWLPPPKQPGFSFQGRLRAHAGGMSISSVNGLTQTTCEAR